MPEHILSRLKKIAERLPDKIAFADETGAVTFAGLYRTCTAAGAFLRTHGLEREPVVVCMEKTHAFATAIFGILSGDCAYVPLDGETPVNRLQSILETTKARAIICDDTTQWRVNRAVKELGEEIRVFLWEDVKGGTLGCARDDMQEEQPEEHPEGVTGDSLAYIMFTSGSAGTPKGVCVTHENLDAYISRLIAIMGFSEETVFASQTPFSTDASLKELFPTVWLGATTWIIPKICFSFPATLLSFLNEHRVNTICWAASAYALTAGMGALDVTKPAFLKTAAFGSERMHATVLRTWMQACPGVRFTNLYGPTEATGVCCFHHVERIPEEGEPLPAGRAFPDTELFLCDEAGNPVPKGDTGEIWIAGPQVAEGYVQDAAMTQAHFIRDKQGRRCYRTGDLGYFDAEGLLYVTGRTDFQFKHMGYRIEPEEIEARGAAVPGVVLCACFYDGVEQMIVFCYTGDATETDIRSRLADTLSRPMQPAKYRKMAALPLNPNGKIDRVRLPEIIRQG